MHMAIIKMKVVDNLLQIMSSNSMNHQSKFIKAKRKTKLVQDTTIWEGKKSPKEHLFGPMQNKKEFKIPKQILVLTLDLDPMTPKIFHHFITTSLLSDLQVKQ